MPRGNGAVEVQLAPDHAHGMKKRKSVRVFVSSHSGFVHQTADSEVGHQQAVELLTHQIGGFAAQRDPGTAQVGLEFVKGGFYLPTLMIESCQFVGWGLARIEDGGGQTIDGLSTLDSLQAVIDHPQNYTVGLVPPVSFGWVHAAQIGAVGQALLTGHAHVLFHPPKQVRSCSPRHLP